MITFRSYLCDDRPWVFKANSSFYQTAHKFDKTFNNAANSALDFLEEQISNPANIYLIVEFENRPIGCIFLSSETPVGGRIRLFFIEERHRGQGVGKLMLRKVLNHAKQSGFETVVVSTFDRHPEACRLYECFGFILTNKMKSNAFGRTMHQLDYLHTLDSE